MGRLPAQPLPGATQALHGVPEHHRRGWTQGKARERDDQKGRRSPGRGGRGTADRRMGAGRGCIERRASHPRGHIRVERPEELLRLYLRLGGLPGLLHTDLSELVTNQMLGDIFSRHSIRAVSLFQDMTRFAMDNLGNTLSAKRISDFLRSQRRSASVDTVLNYLAILDEACWRAGKPSNGKSGPFRCSTTPTPATCSRSTLTSRETWRE